MRNFVAPDLMSYFITVLRGLSRPAAALYLSCQGGALLKYQPSFSGLESQVLVAGSTVHPSVFLKGVVTAGKLFILDRDAFWMNEGLLTEQHLGQANGLRIDAAAVDEPLSIRDRDEL